MAVGMAVNTLIFPYDNSNQIRSLIDSLDQEVIRFMEDVFDGDNMVASGVTMEAWSVEDNGEGICFYVYVYNVQPGITIDYATGESCLAVAEEQPVPPEEAQTYILNINSKKFHLPTCSGAASIKEENRQESPGSRQELLDQGYEPCKTCDP